MIREADANAGKNPRRAGPRAALMSLERHLSRSGSVTEKKACQAQQLVYDAWEAPTEEHERALIREALEIDPANVDALLKTLDYSRVAGDDEIVLLRQIVAAGEKSLGPKVFKECAGGFWGFIETRPYMRARQRLAETLRVAGRLEESITEYQSMLELNPHDNQGVRHLLLPILLTLNRLDEARELFKKYRGDLDFNVVFAWGRVLERFLSADLPGASAALKVAWKQNPAMQSYVNGHRPVPKQLPEAYAPGSRDEAICFAEVLRAAWIKHPAALKWLATQKVK